MNELIRPGITMPANHVPITVLPPPTSASSTSPQLPPVFLMRQDSHVQFAYARKKKFGTIKLDHHAPGWGRVFFAVVYHRVGDLSTYTFQAPAEGEEQYVAIKMLNKSVIARHLEQNGAEDPYKEIAVMNEIGDNTHVLGCIETLDDEKHLYIVTKKACSQGTLKDAIWGSNRRLDISRVRCWFRQIVNILAYLREEGVNHRDISPDNILFLTPDHLVLFDLGMSLRWDTNEDGQRLYMRPQGNFGTRPYMAPEIYKNRVYDGVATDQWSAVVILYNMLTNQVLYYKPIVKDTLFKFNVLARSVSSSPVNDLAREVYNSADSAQHHELYRRAVLHQSLQRLQPDAMEVLENALKMNPLERWSLDQLQRSTFLTQT